MLLRGQFVLSHAFLGPCLPPVTSRKRNMSNATVEGDQESRKSSSTIKSLTADCINYFKSLVYSCNLAQPEWDIVEKTNFFILLICGAENYIETTNNYLQLMIVSFSWCTILILLTLNAHAFFAREPESTDPEFF